MDIREAQQDLRRAFVGGGPGVIVSGLVWLIAGMVERTEGVKVAFVTLFIGGMLIFPLSALAVRFVFRRRKQTAGNPLGAVVLECTVAMIAGLVVAWLFLPFRPEFVFPAAAIAVGTHYAVFRTAYGDVLFLALGGLVTAVGLVSLFTAVPIPGGPVLAVGAIELLFGIVLTGLALRTQAPAS